MIYDTFTENDNYNKLTAYQELLQLIDLAEKVSAKIGMLRDANKIFMLMFVLMSMAGILMILLEVLDLTSLTIQVEMLKPSARLYISGIIITLGILSPSWLWFHYTKQLTSERATLRKLFNMIATQKQLAQNEMSILTKETIELRLNRIDFSVAK